MKVQAINSNYQQNKNYNQKVNPSFTALKSVAYRDYFCPHTSLGDAKMVKGLLDNPAFQKFCTKYDVIAEFSMPSLESNKSTILHLHCKEALKDNKPNNMFQKIKDFFKTDKRESLELIFYSNSKDFNTLSETELEKEINRTKEFLISKKQEAKERAEILKSIKEKL